MGLDRLVIDKKMNIGRQQYERFKKQIVLKKIGISGQKKIFRSNVLVIGLGGLGCPLIIYLAACPFKSIIYSNSNSFLWDWVNGYR